MGDGMSGPDLRHVTTLAVKIVFTRQTGLCIAFRTKLSPRQGQNSGFLIVAVLSGYVKLRKKSDYIASSYSGLAADFERHCGSTQSKIFARVLIRLIDARLAGPAGVVTEIESRCCRCTERICRMVVLRFPPEGPERVAPYHLSVPQSG